MRRIALIAHNIRSAHNIGSLLRTADGLGVQVFLTGYSPYPSVKGDMRLPHIRDKVTKRIHKTALGAEDTADWQHIEDIDKCLEHLRQKGYLIAALEQTPTAIDLKDYESSAKLALIVGSEVDGLEDGVLEQAPVHLQIPMRGAKESFNVAAAAAMALYHLAGT